MIMGLHQVLIGIFYSQIVESSSLVSVLFENRLAIPTSPFSFTSKWLFNWRASEASEASETLSGLFN